MLSAKWQPYYSDLDVLTCVALTNKYNIMAVEAQGSCVTRPSAVMELIVSLIGVNSNNQPGLNLVLRPPNERRRYFVTTSLIGWAQT